MISAEVFSVVLRPVIVLIAGDGDARGQGYRGVQTVHVPRGGGLKPGREEGVREKEGVRERLTPVPEGIRESSGEHFRDVLDHVTDGEGKCKPVVPMNI